MYRIAIQLPLKHTFEVARILDIALDSFFEVNATTLETHRHYSNPHNALRIMSKLNCIDELKYYVSQYNPKTSSYTVIEEEM